MFLRAPVMLLGSAGAREFNASGRAHNHFNQMAVCEDGEKRHRTQARSTRQDRCENTRNHDGRDTRDTPVARRRT